MRRWTLAVLLAVALVADFSHPAAAAAHELTVNDIPRYLIQCVLRRDASSRTCQAVLIGMLESFQVHNYAHSLCPANPAGAAQLGIQCGR